MARSGLALPSVLVCLLLSSAAAQEYTFGQATWYDAIYNGFCGFGRNIPSNGFVGAWPLIETNPPPSGFWQPPAQNGCADVCFEVSCVPQFVESADGSIYLDRRDACADTRRAVVIKIVDECRCSLPQNGGPRGNFQWCCNTATPRLGINRHIDLSKQAFTALVKDGNFNLGILGIRWRHTSCANLDRGVITLPSTPPMPDNTNMTQGVPDQSELPPTMPPGMTPHDMASTGHVRLTEDRQCGGRGGFCSMFGGCNDAPFTTHKCAEGLECRRQNEWYWQCIKKTTTPSPGKPGSGGGSSSGGSGGKTIQQYKQCGGMGAQCKSMSGICVDDPFPGYKCKSGLRCVRQNTYYWQCVNPKEVSKLGAGWSLNKPQTSSKCPNFVGESMQCGGKGGRCASELNVCADKPASGVCCEPGQACVRQNEWWWGCKKN